MSKNIPLPTLGEFDLHDAPLVCVVYNTRQALLRLVIDPSVYDDYPERPRALEFQKVRELKLSGYDDVRDLRDFAEIHRVKYENIGGEWMVSFFLIVSELIDGKWKKDYANLDFICSDELIID